MTSEQIKEIAENLDMGFKCFVHKETLEMIFIPDEDKHPDMEMDVWQKEFKAIKKGRNKYFEFLGIDSRDSFKVMEQFIETVDDEQLRLRLEQALIRPRPFWNFKYEIDNSGPFREKWFAFKEGKLVEWVEKQLLSHIINT